ncbi:hypothetical protein JTE90_018840 [Oedothorax gibbosus]|uniref:Uncharacterized protein n=1 Tax=Oedothorax gibbosus TaxID=931172 RepID=A0AAV6UUU0_9ARAC|nr:hypothetical protein JTE90_018840 [Oedothorax gibbosus]
MPTESTDLQKESPSIHSPHQITSSFTTMEPLMMEVSKSSPILSLLDDTKDLRRNAMRTGKPKRGTDIDAKVT